MGTGVCLKGTKMYPLMQPDFFNLMMYILIEMLLSFRNTILYFCVRD